VALRRFYLQELIFLINQYFNYFPVALSANSKLLWIFSSRFNR